MNHSQRERVRSTLVEVGVLEIGGPGNDDTDADAPLFAAYRRLAERVTGSTMGSCEESDPWPERIRTGLGVLLAALASEPEVAMLLTRGFPGIDAETYACYVDLLAGFLPAMRQGREWAETEELPESVELLAVGAAEALIFSEVDAGRAEGLPRMLPEILFTILVPFIGPERAAEEMQSAAAAS